MATNDEITTPLLPADDTLNPLEINTPAKARPLLPTICLIVTPIAVLIPLLFVLAVVLPRHADDVAIVKGEQRLS